MARTALSLTLLAVRATAEQPLGITLDLYHAVSAATSSFRWQNINPAGIMGVLKYIHTEVIAEHEVSPPDRRGRKDNLEAISRANFKVKNPATMPGHLLDFGPFMHFEGGRTYDSNGLQQLAAQGEFVGIQKQTDVRYPTKQPYFWFSLAGPCPNLPYDRKDGNSDPECLQYDGTSLGATGPVSGGLCSGGSGNTSIEPTGRPGCTYSYGEVTSVNLDELVGITQEDCGGRRCRDWYDFRQFCTNNAYRWMFSAQGDNVSTSFCVEYDVHPKCAADCGSEACASVPEQLREAGLPFWRGRCQPEANQIRAEKLAQAFGISGASTSHRLVSGEVREEFGTCVHEVPGTCAPAEGQGGMYCTRGWAGVCQPCFVPGTHALWPARSFMPTCPYDILHNPDYEDRFPAPACKSDKPSDLCCLYTGTCSPSQANPETLPLNDDGYALVASLQDTAAMATFLGRLRGRDGRSAAESAGEGSLEAFAYWQWGDSPAKARTLQSVKNDMFARGLISSATSTTTATRTITTTAAPTTAATTTARTTEAPATPASTVSTTATGAVPSREPVMPVENGGVQHHDLPNEPHDHGHEQELAEASGGKWWMWLLLSVGVVLTLLGIGALLYARRRRLAKAAAAAATADEAPAPVAPAPAPAPEPPPVAAPQGAAEVPAASQLPQAMMPGLSPAVVKLLSGDASAAPPASGGATTVPSLPGYSVPAALAGLHPVTLQVLAAAGALLPMKASGISAQPTPLDGGGWQAGYAAPPPSGPLAPCPGSARLGLGAAGGAVGTMGAMGVVGSLAPPLPALGEPEVKRLRLVA